MEKKKHEAIALMESVFRHCPDGYIYTVLLHKNYKVNDVKKIKYFELKKITLIPNYISILINNFDCYFSPTVCSKDLGCHGRSKDDIKQWPTLWCDIDIYKFDENKQRQIWKLINDFHLQPSFIIKSGKGIHVYWILKEPSGDRDLIKNYLDRLAIYFSGDRGSAEVAHLLRIPQTKNHKYNLPENEVSIIGSRPEKEYNLDDFDFLLEVKETPNGEERPRLPEGWEKELLEGVENGERNVSIARLAGRYIGKGLSREETLPILLDVNARFNPPLDVKEVVTCLDSVLKTDERNHLDNEAPVNCQEKSEHHFTLIRARDIVSTQEPETQWIWEGTLPSAGSSLVVAKPKIGKTTLALQLAVAISRGDTFLGKKTRQATVVYLALEEHRGEVQKTLSLLGVTNEPLLIHFGPAPAKAMEEVEPLIRETGAKFLVIDILQKFCRVRDLNDYAQVTRALEPLMAIARKIDCHILLTHHAGKKERDDGDDILGSTGLLGGVDSSIHIKKRNRESRVFFTIQRYGMDVPQTVIALKDGHLLMEGKKEDVETEETIPLILEVLEEGSLTEKEIWEKIEKGHSFVSKGLRKLVEQKMVNRTGIGKRGSPFVYEKDSLLVSPLYMEEGRRERESGDNPQGLLKNISPDDFQKNQTSQEGIRKEFLPDKEGLFEVMDDGQLTY